MLLQSPPRNNGNQGQHAIIKVSDRTIYVAQLTNQIACYIVRWREKLLNSENNERCS